MPAPSPKPSACRGKTLVSIALVLLGTACSDGSSESSTTKGVASTTGAPSSSGGSTLGGTTKGDSATTSPGAVTTTSASTTMVAGPTSSGNDSTASSASNTEASSSATAGTDTSGTTGAGGVTSATTNTTGTSSSGDPMPGGEVTLDGPRISVGGEALHLRGVSWNPIPQGGTHPGDLAYAQFAAQDIALMRAAGINAVRTYEPLTDTGVLDALADAGIFVLNTVFPYGGNPASAVDAPVNAVKDHPAILAWVIGNEWNYNGLYVDLSLDASIQLINEVIDRIRDLDASHPIATVYGELPDASVIERLSGIDVWGLNVYSGRSFGDRFTQWAARSEKPMFFGEYGADAWNATTGQYDPESQATATHDLTQEILDNSTLAGGVCSGGTIFEFADEWWKDQSGSPDAQDVGGIAPGGGPFPDSTFNEEYWGIVTIDRVPRPAYDVLKELYTE